jgi:chaperonin GroES
VECPYQPLNDYVLLKRIEEGVTEIRGIVIPDSAQKKNNKAEVIAVGPGCNALEDGDIVLFTRYGGTDTELDDEDYILVRSAEVYLKLRRKPLVRAAS